MWMMIAGSRQATDEMLECAQACVQFAFIHQHRIVVGDNPKGIDAYVVSKCAEMLIPCTIVGINPPCGDACEYLAFPARNGALNKRAFYVCKGKTYTERDRLMVDMVNFGVFIWDGRSPGTIAGYNYALSVRKVATLYNFGDVRETEKIPR